MSERDVLMLCPECEEFLIDLRTATLWFCEYGKPTQFSATCFQCGCSTVDQASDAMIEDLMAVGVRINNCSRIPEDRERPDDPLGEEDLELLLYALDDDHFFERFRGFAISKHQCWS